MAPVFTLRLGDAQVKEFISSFRTRTRWLLESDDLTWAPLCSGEGNVNGPDHSEWAKQWATERVAEHSPYTVTAWVHDDATDTWTAELKRIRHDFRIAFMDDEVATAYAKNAAGAEETRQRVLDGERFVELMLGDNPVLINLAHVGTLIYCPTEVDL
jgi:hypothetical protein